MHGVIGIASNMLAVDRQWTFACSTSLNRFTAGNVFNIDMSVTPCG